MSVRIYDADDDLIEQLRSHTYCLKPQAADSPDWFVMDFVQKK
jgi:hypothetical protein